MQFPDLDALIVENLEDIEASYKRLFVVQKVVFQHLDYVVETWARKIDWSGEFNFLDDTLWMAPRTWVPSDGAETSDCKAWFKLDVGEDDDEEGGAEADNFYLTRLCRSGVGEMILKCVINHKNIGVSKPEVKRRVRAIADQIRPLSVSPEGVIYFPVYIDKMILSKAIVEDSIEDALEPLKKSLGHFETAVATIERLFEG